MFNDPSIGVMDPRLEPQSLLLPATASFDIRSSGYKTVPVDANLFPAGWHQLCSVSKNLAVLRLRRWLQEQAFDTASIIVLLEPFTRNAAYLESAWFLAQIAAEAVETVYVAMDLEALPPAGHTFQTVHGPLFVHRFNCSEAGIPRLNGVERDCPVLLNSDLSAGPGLLAGLRGPVFPPAALGWYRRSKEDFFNQWNRLAPVWAEDLQIEPWQLSIRTEVVDCEDFYTHSMRDLADTVSDVLAYMRTSYRHYEIADAPFVVVKSTCGTFGRGVLVLSDATELSTIPAKVARNMNRGQGGSLVNRFLVQEGVYTRDLVRGCPSEPVIYACGGSVIGGFYRSHCGKDPATSLNAPGMVFAAMCLSDDPRHALTESCHADAERQPRYYAVGRLALQALGAEIKATA